MLVVFVLGLLFAPVFSNLTKLVDLTWDFSNETIYWGTITPFKYTKMVANDIDKGYWYAENEFCAGEHGGTHFDAPYHFYKEGWKVGDVPVDRLVGKGAVLEVSGKLLLSQHLEDWVSRNGQFEDNTILLVRFGWSQFWPNRTSYMAIDTAGNLNFPGLSVDAANWIAKSGKIVGVGVDVASVDAGTQTDLMVHRILSKQQIYNMENVKMVERLPEKGFTVIALPMKLKDGTGAPLRVLAVPSQPRN